MDASWNSSQWVSVHRGVTSPTSRTNNNTHDDDDDDDDDGECLPQLDGLTDNKSRSEIVILVTAFLSYLRYLVDFKLVASYKSRCLSMIIQKVVSGFFIGWGYTASSNAT